MTLNEIPLKMMRLSTDQLDPTNSRIREEIRSKDKQKKVDKLVEERVKRLGLGLE